MKSFKMNSNRRNFNVTRKFSPRRNQEDADHLYLATPNRIRSIGELIALLRLPSQRRVLELVDTQAVPFTGQGFASDALTGGLVGINRAKKQVVFAEQKSSQ